MNAFLEDLRRELVDAAEREDAREGSRARRWRARGRRVRVGRLLGAVAVAAAALLLVTTFARRAEDTEREARPAPGGIGALAGVYEVSEPLRRPDTIYRVTFHPAGALRCRQLLGSGDACYELESLGARLTPAESSAYEPTSWGVVSVQGDRLTLVAAPGQTCAGRPGTYAWRRAGARLVLRAAADPCPAGANSGPRQAVLTRGPLVRR